MMWKIRTGPLMQIKLLKTRPAQKKGVRHCWDEQASQLNDGGKWEEAPWIIPPLNRVKHWEDQDTRHGSQTCYCGNLQQNNGRCLTSGYALCPVQLPDRKVGLLGVTVAPIDTCVRTETFRTAETIFRLTFLVYFYLLIYVIICLRLSI